MTMTESAIRELKQADAIEKANEAMPRGVIDLIALPNDFSNHDVEKHMPHRRSYRASFVTAIIAEFASYIIDHRSASMSCFVDPDDMSAQTIFDLEVDGQPGHGDHRANIHLQKTPEYAELLSVHGNSIAQQGMAEFIEDHIDFLSFYDADGEEMNRAKVVSAIRKINIEEARQVSSEVGDFHAERSAMESVKANSDGGLPTTVIFTCTPYESLGLRGFNCRLSISEGRNGVNLRLTIRSLEREKAEMAEEFAGLISESLAETDMPVYRGKYRY